MAVISLYLRNAAKLITHINKTLKSFKLSVPNCTKFFKMSMFIGSFFITCFPSLYIFMVDIVLL